MKDLNKYSKEYMPDDSWNAAFWDAFHEVKREIAFVFTSRGYNSRGVHTRTTDDVIKELVAQQDTHVTDAFDKFKYAASFGNAMCKYDGEEICADGAGDDCDEAFANFFVYLSESEKNDKIEFLKKIQHERFNREDQQYQWKEIERLIDSTLSIYNLKTKPALLLKEEKQKSENMRLEKVAIKKKEKEWAKVIANKDKITKLIIINKSSTLEYAPQYSYIPINGENIMDLKLSYYNQFALFSKTEALLNISEFEGQIIDKSTIPLINEGKPFYIKDIGFETLEKYKSIDEFLNKKTYNAKKIKTSLDVANIFKSTINDFSQDLSKSINNHAKTIAISNEIIANSIKSHGKTVSSATVESGKRIENGLNNVATSIVGVGGAIEQSGDRTADAIYSI